MAYLLIESRDPFESNDVRHVYALASGLARNGHAVTLFLVQNGVLASRPGPGAEGLRAVAAAGVEVLADAFSLRERAIAEATMLGEVRAAPLDTVVDRLLQGHRALWH